MSTIFVDNLQTPGTISEPSKPFSKVIPQTQFLRLPAASAMAASRVCAMNWQTGLGLIARHVLTTIGGGLVASGAIDSGQLETGIGAIMVLSGIAWSVWQKKNASKGLV